MAEIQELRDQMERQREEAALQREQQREEMVTLQRQQLEQQREQMEQQMTDQLREMENGLLRRDRQNDMGELIDVLRRQGGRTKVTPPTFDGKQDVSKFLETFEEVKEINDWNNHTAAIQLKLALKGRVADTTQGTTYAELRDFLLRRYEVTEDEARRQVKTAKIRRGENIYDFGDYLLRMMVIAHPDLQPQQIEGLAVKQIVDLIGDGALRRELRNQHPTDYKDALKRIQEYLSDMGEKPNFRRLETDGMDELEQVKKRMDGMETRLNEVETTVITGQKDLMGMMKKLSETGSSGGGDEGRSDGEKRTCHYCKKPGHLIKDCFKRQREEKQQDGQKSENFTGRSA